MLKTIINFILDFFKTEDKKEVEMKQEVPAWKLKLVVEREIKTEESTIGKLYLMYPDGTCEYFCDTLEDKVRNSITTPIKEFFKIKSKTAIPYGIYEVVLSYSNRFKVIMPELLDVPHFTGIRIHTGNTAADTDGCILLGTYKNQKDFIANSRVAYNKFMDILEPISKTGKIIIEIKDKQA